MLLTFNAVVGADKWSNGVCIFLSILAIIITCGFIYLLVQRYLTEREKIIEEKRSYIDGVLSKSETISTVNSIISKSTFDSPFGLIYLDIDKFSELTNAFNEKIAGEVLKQLVVKFQKVLPLQVQIGRLGLDKFLFIFRPEYNPDEIMHTANSIKNLFEETVKVSYDVEISLTASIGVAYFPRHGRNAAQLLESLNIAIYTAKRDGGDRIVVYSEEMSQKEGENLQYYAQVKEGIKNKEFILYYQPIIDVEKHEVVGAEALLRWEHSKLGLINPNDFIHILEQSGDIYWVGIWGLEEMIKKYAEVHRNFPGIEFKISINMSPKQLMNEKIAVDFQRILKRYKMFAKDLIIEIEEFMVFEQQQTIRNNILKLKELGFLFAVDGFALDHNTLSKIEKLPIDIIKINSSFLQEEENLEIRKHITEVLFEYARNKNIKLVAERIENLEMSKYYQDNGVVIDQGFYFSKPIPGEKLLEYIKDKEHLEILIDPSKKVEQAPVSEVDTEQATGEATCQSNNQEEKTEEIKEDEAVNNQPDLPQEETKTSEEKTDKKD